METQSDTLPELEELKFVSIDIPVTITYGGKRHSTLIANLKSPIFRILSLGNIMTANNEQMYLGVVDPINYLVNQKVKVIKGEDFITAEILTTVYGTTSDNLINVNNRRSIKDKGLLIPLVSLRIGKATYAMEYYDTLSLLPSLNNRK